MAANTQWTYTATHSPGNARTVRGPHLQFAVESDSLFLADHRYSNRSTRHEPCHLTMALIILLQPAYVTRRPHAPIQSAYQCPPAPRIPYLPLPGYPIPYRRPRTPDLFPIALSQPGLFPVQASRLSVSIPAFTMISVRDTSNQMLCNVKTGSAILTTADFVQFLQYFVCTRLASYAGLSPVVQQSVEVNFVHRHGGNARAVWERFVHGTPRFGGPTGLDILLGNTILWLLDMDTSGVWIATVDIPRSSSWS
ncbi:hypothetical protein DFH09DRAFT_1365018 [Mycena vulgaris]|nr:hypothetical protein DFH09DRAFT_1365018 [Mycena vulgaris]